MEQRLKHGISDAAKIGMCNSSAATVLAGRVCHYPKRYQFRRITEAHARLCAFSVLCGNVCGKGMGKKPIAEDVLQ